MLNILFLCASDKLSGPNRQLYYLINSILNSKNIRLHLIFCRLDIKSSNSIIPYLESINSNNLIIHIPKKIRNNKISRLLMVVETFNILNKNKKSFVQTCGIFPDFSLFMLKFILRNKISWISLLRSQIFIEYPIRFRPSFLGNLLALIHRFIISRADINIFVSRSVKNNISLKKINTFILYNSLSHDHEEEIKNTLNPDFISRKNQTQVGFKFIYVGHFDYLKNPLTLVESWKEINNKNFYLKLIGGDPYSLYSKRINSLLMSLKNVEIVGFEKNIIKHYIDSDFFITASLSEGFPNCVIEALCSGCICVLSNIPPHLEINKIFPNYVICFDPSSISELVKAINKATNMRNIFSKLNVSNDSIKVFTSRKLTNKYFKILEAYL